MEDNSTGEEVSSNSASCTPILENLIPEERRENPASNMSDEVDPDVNSNIFLLGTEFDGNKLAKGVIQADKSWYQAIFYEFLQNFSP